MVVSRINLKPTFITADHGEDISNPTVKVQIVHDNGESYYINLSTCDSPLNQTPYVVEGIYGANNVINIPVKYLEGETYLKVYVNPRPDPTINYTSKPFEAFFGDSETEILKKCIVYAHHASGTVRPVPHDELHIPHDWDYHLIDKPQTIVIEAINDESLKTEATMTLITQNKIVRNAPRALTRNESSIMINILPQGASGVYCTDGADVVPLNTDIRTHAQWGVIHVNESGYESEITPSMWALLGANTDSECLTRPCIVARHGGVEYTCYRAATVLPVNSIPYGGGLSVTVLKSDYKIGDTFNKEKDIEVSYRGTKLSPNQWDYLGFENTSTGTYTITIAHDPIPEEVGRVTTARYTINVKA